MNKLVAVTIVSAATAVVSLGVSAYTVVREKMALKRLNKAIGNIEEKSDEKITDSLIEKAVQKSANGKVDKYMQDVDDQVLRCAHRDLEIQAKNAVEKYSADIREKAAEEVAKQVENLDIEKLKSRVCDMAERHALEKFDDCLDKYAQDFEKQMENQRKLYDRITRAALEKENDNKDGLRVVLW